MAESYLLHGLNSVDLDERVSTILDTLDPGGFGSNVLDLTEASVVDVRNAVQATPFFGGLRTVVLKNLNIGRQPGSSQKAPDWTGIEEALAAIPITTAVLIPIHTTLAARSRPIKFASAAGWNVEQFSTPRGRNLIDWTISRFRQSGVLLDQMTARTLLARLFPTAWEREARYETQTVDMRLLATEIERLVTASVDGQLDVSTVVALVPDRSGVTAFKLNDATFSGRIDQSLQELDQVLSSGDAPERVLAQLAREISVLVAARNVDEFGVEDVARAADLSSGQVSMTVSRKSGWRNSASLDASMESTRNAEWLVKTGRTQRTESVIVPLTAEIAARFRR